MGRARKLSGSKYSKFIFCLMDLTIVLLIVAFVFKLSLANSQIEQISRLPSNQISCMQCGGAQKQQDDETCCEEASNGECINQKLKENCKEELIAVKKKLVQFYTNNLTALIILGGAFLTLECCLQRCLTCIMTKLNRNTQEKQGQRLLKSGAISTLNIEQFSSSSSASSFSSLSYSAENKNLQKSFCYKMEELACPSCLETMSQQQVVSLGCRHIIHSSCARQRNSTCPICS